MRIYTPFPVKPCPKCGAPFAGPAIGAHMKTAHAKALSPGAVFQCGDCGNETELPSYWNPHVAFPGDAAHPRRRLCRGCWDRSYGLPNLS